MFDRYYSFGIFNTTFGIWHSSIGYDMILEEMILAYKDNVVTKHSEKYMYRRKKMTRLFYKDSNISFIKSFFRKYLIWI